MILSSVILVIDSHFNDWDLILSSVNSDEFSCELLIFNNGGNVPIDIKVRTSHYAERKNPFIELSFAECVNELLPYCIGDYIVVMYNYGIFSDGWLMRLINTYNTIDKSGIVSVPTKDHLIGEYLPLLNKQDNLDSQYFDDNKVDGVIMFSKEILNSLGGFNTNLHDKHVFWDYCNRSGALGRYNYYVSDTYMTVVDHYHSSYLSDKRIYALEKEKKAVRKDLKDIHDYKQIIDALKEIGLESTYAKMIGKVVVITTTLSDNRIKNLIDICFLHGYNFEIFATGYFESYLFKSRVGIYLTKIL